MLILKNPLTLQSISDFGIHSDSLGEKICGNYQVFGTMIEGEDLIHMTMQEPDIYVGIQNNGPFLVDSQIHADNQVRLELVSQLINRIMLYDSPAFTYQDEVFVASLLQKLGVTDVNEFMRLVKLHMEKNELTVSLISRYFDQGREFARTVSQFFESHVYGEQELEVIKNEYQSDLYLHNGIFRRLMTAECSNSVYTYQNPVRTGAGVVRSFHNMEWMRQADRIQLSQLRENIFYQTDPAVYNDCFTYEIRPLAVNELTQRKVIGRMSAAILENLVAAVSYELRYEYGGTNIWKDYSRILYGSSENTLERFRMFQSEGGIREMQIREYMSLMNELTRDELHLTQLLEFVDRYDLLQENDTVYEDMTRNILLSVLENHNLQKQLAREIRRVYPPAEREQSDRYYLEEKNICISEMTRSDRAYRVLRQKRNENYFSAVTEVQARDVEISDEDSVPGLLAVLREEIARKERETGIGRAGKEPVRGAADRSYDGEPLSAPVQAADREHTVYEMIREYAMSEAASSVPLMENAELLERIDRHNVYMKQLLDRKEPVRDRPRQIVVDRAQAREAALRALDDPEQVLREIYESAADGRNIPGGIPAEVERILSVTDENTRSYYERLMGYRDQEISSPGSVTGEAYEDEPEADGHSAREEAEERRYLETIREVLRTTDTDTRELYRQSVAYRNAELAHPRDVPAYERTLTREERERLEAFQRKVYLLLHRIEQRESRYRVYEGHTAARTQEIVRDVQREMLRHEVSDVHNIDVDEMVSLEHLYTARHEQISLLHTAEKEIQLVHRTREQTSQEVLEEVLETLENSDVLRRNVEEKSEEALLTRRQLESIRSEIVTQSREYITHMVERNMKTQVHEISDMVYLELERRLKNEQRRRGY